MAYSCTPHFVFPGMNVTCLLYLSVTDITKLYLFIEVSKTSMKSIVVVWSGFGRDMIGRSDLYGKCHGVI